MLAINHLLPSSFFQPAMLVGAAMGQFQDHGGYGEHTDVIRDIMRIAKHQWL